MMHPDRKWRVVPIEPTTAMLIAGNHGQPGDFSAAKCWADMIESAERTSDYTRPRIESSAKQEASPQPAPHAMTDKDAAFLTWVADRLVHVYGESSNVDFVQKLRALAQPAAVEPAKPTINEEFLAFNTKTSKGGRDALKWYFANVLKRHDFQRYIENRIAADFACVLSGHLQSTPAVHAGKGDAE